MATDSKDGARAKAVGRLGILSELPKERIEEVFAAALEEVEKKPQSSVSPVERAIMRTSERLWLEEKTKGKR